MKKILSILFFLLFAAGIVLAQNVVLSKEARVSPKGIRSYDAFKGIPILDDGRLKPLDTYARNLLLQVSSKDTYNRKPAIEWLAAVLFAPDTTRDDKVFLINNPDIAVALGIEPDQHRRYSYAQIEKAYPKFSELAQAAENINEKQRSIVESEILRVFQNFTVYEGLSHEFLFALPSKEFSITSPGIIKALRLPSDRTEFSFLDIAFHADDIRAATADLENKDSSLWSEDQKELMQLSAKLFKWSMSRKALPMGVIPSSQDPETWISPWDAATKDFKDEETRQLIGLWRNMSVDYWDGKNVEFDLDVRTYKDLLSKRITAGSAKIAGKFPLELAYHSLRPFLFAKIFYIFALLFFVASFVSKSRVWYSLTWGAVIAGFVPNLLGLIARIIIMNRPPVTNLYETFIFVSVIAVALGILIERVNKQWLGLVVAGVSGTALLFIASKYSVEGDTLKMLVAVLDSNFWLSTHVTTITIGYAATCVAGILGHIWLLQAAARRSRDILDNTYTAMVGILGLALTLTFLGTNLGGVWADQSWGRFWGWDPKENGALMIVLWSAMLFHARVSKMIGDMNMAVGNVLGMIVVMWAWFGVNLLSIGLHSYGFTSGIANALLIYVICEIIFLVVTTSLIKRRT